MDNLETVRVLIERWNAGDYEDVFELYHDDIVVTTSPSWPEQQVVRGKEPFRAWSEEWRELWEVAQIRADELRANGDKVAARGVWESRGRVSGVEGSMPFIAVMTLRHGRVVEFQWFDDYEEALRAAGL